MKGQIVMRIEDLDAPRVVDGAADAFCEDHLWLGLDWDEGPVYQSEREHLYSAALSELQDRGHLFLCTCSRKEIAAVASAPHDGMGPRYPGTCRAGPTKPDRPAATRFIAPEQTPSFEDVLFGSCGGGPDAGDFVVRRADGVWAYQLAVVVDDIDMRISEVVRGADLLSSTPSQIALHRALGYREPAFFHVPLVLDTDGTRMSNRHGAVTISELRNWGLAPEVVVGVLAHSLGIQPDPRPATPAELLGSFEVGHIDKEPVINPLPVSN